MPVLPSCILTVSERLLDLSLSLHPDDTCRRLRRSERLPDRYSWLCLPPGQSTTRKCRWWSCLSTDFAALQIKPGFVARVSVTTESLSGWTEPPEEPVEA